MPEGKPRMRRDDRVKQTKGRKDFGKVTHQTPEQLPDPSPVMQPPVQPTKPVSSRLPPPSKLRENRASAPNVSTKEDSAFKESIFGEERRLKPANREVEFSPSSTGYTSLINDIYLSYKNEERRQMTKEMPIELVRYYAACMCMSVGYKAFYHSGDDRC
jgi:hypothetical protein